MYLGLLDKDKVSIPLQAVSRICTDDVIWVIEYAGFNRICMMNKNMVAFTVYENIWHQQFHISYFICREDPRPVIDPVVLDGINMSLRLGDTVAIRPGMLCIDSRFAEHQRVAA